MEETAQPAYFGEWLKRRRSDLDLTQAELAYRTGCSVPALRKIEAGERRPSKQLAELLARSLKIPSEDQTDFVRVARGELDLGHLHPQVLDEPSIDTRGLRSPSVMFNVPALPTPLIGRETELASLAKLMAEPECRLLTISGMGGIGKTRLAIEFARQGQSIFPGGVYYAPLTSLNAPEFIVPAIAEALGLTLSGALDPREQLINHLTSRDEEALLVVLDSLENLLVISGPENRPSDATTLISELLKRQPKLKILITSRERIGLQGEWTFELQGLPFPTTDRPDKLESYGAMALFLQRAAQVKADFKVLPEEWPFVVKICQFVDGTPLAIELAASWVGMLSIEEIAHEIITSLDFLTSVMRDVPERHRSLRVTFDHSWKLLSVDEQRCLCQLAVFRGGFRREAAEQVAGASLPVLMSLYSKSLLIHRQGGRYDLHEVVRQYALSHVNDDPQCKGSAARHCAYYLEIVQGQGRALGGATQFDATQILSEELDNLRTAMAWGLENLQAETSLQIAHELEPFWLTQGYWREGLEWLERGLDSPGSISDIVKANALTSAGTLSRYLGEIPRAIAALQESLRLMRQINDRTGLAMTLFNLGASVIRQGDTSRATDLLEEALSLSQQAGYRAGVYLSTEYLGHAASRQGNSHQAIDYYNRALALAREANDENQVGELLASLGDENLILGDIGQAEVYLNLATPICTRLGNRFISAFISGDRGIIAMKQGNFSLAFDLLSETIPVLQELGDKEEIILWFAPMAYIVKELGFPDRAARMLGASESLRNEIGVIRSKINQENFELYANEVCKQLGNAAFDAAWSEGSVLTYEQAIAYAVYKP